MRKEAVISNSKLNDRGTRVLTSGIDISQYQRNPILLWQHNRPYRGTKDEVLPIGRMENLRIDGDNLIGTPVFDENDDFAKQIKSKWDAGFLKMVSAGIDIIEVSEDVALMVLGQRRATVTKSKLFEVSIVDIGALDDAIVFRKDGRILNLASGEDALIIPEITFKNDLNTDKMKSIALKLGLSETATEADILTKIGSLQTLAANAESLQKQIDEQFAKSIDSVVDAAVKAKKITADKKEHFVKLGKTSGIDVLTSTLEMLEKAVKPADVILNGKAATQTADYKKLSDVPEAERMELRVNDVEKYRALYRAEYGFEPKL
jgi:hypothetical protein